MTKATLMGSSRGPSKREVEQAEVTATAAALEAREQAASARHEAIKAEAVAKAAAVRAAGASRARRLSPCPLWPLTLLSSALLLATASDERPQAERQGQGGAGEDGAA